MSHYSITKRTLIEAKPKQGRMIEAIFSNSLIGVYPSYQTVAWDPDSGLARLDVEIKIPAKGKTYPYVDAPELAAYEHVVKSYTFTDLIISVGEAEAVMNEACGK